MIKESSIVTNLKQTWCHSNISHWKFINHPPIEENLGLINTLMNNNNTIDYYLPEVIWCSSCFKFYISIGKSKNHAIIQEIEINSQTIGEAIANIVVILIIGKLLSSITLTTFMWLPHFFKLLYLMSFNFI